MDNAHRQHRFVLFWSLSPASLLTGFRTGYPKIRHLATFVVKGKEFEQTVEAERSPWPAPLPCPSSLKQILKPSRERYPSCTRDRELVAKSVQTNFVITKSEFPTSLPLTTHGPNPCVLSFFTNWSFLFLRELELPAGTSLGLHSAVTALLCM